MRGLAIVAALVAALGVARADDTFDAKAAGAQRVERFDDLVWALTASCDSHGRDDTEQRQCRVVRDHRARELAAQTLLVDADPGALELGPWNAKTKSATLTLTSCIRCAGVEVGGKRWFLVGNGGPAQKVAGDRVRAAVLATSDKMLADDAAAKAFAKQVASARVQMVVKLASPAKWSEGGHDGLAFEVLAFRAYTPCDGQVLAAKPASGPVEPDKRACAGGGSAEPEHGTKAVDTASLPEALDVEMIKNAMRPVVTAAERCFNKFNAAGKARLKITVNGDGSVEKHKQTGDFVGTATGDCIDAAVKLATFPKTQKPQQTFAYPLTLK